MATGHENDILIKIVGPAPLFGIIAGLAGGAGMRWISGFAAGCAFCALCSGFQKIHWPKG